MQTLKDRQNLHKFLERKAELAVRGEESAQKIVPEAEAEMEIRIWEKRNSDNALCETHQELESQRLQLQQANQWADQAQREKINLRGELEKRSRLNRENRAKDYPPTVSQLFTQIQDLQKRVNSLSDAILGRRAALESPTFPVNRPFRVPEQSLAIFWITRNMGTSGNVFERPAREGPSALLENSKKLASSRG